MYDDRNSVPAVKMIISKHHKIINGPQAEGEKERGKMRGSTKAFMYDNKCGL